MVITSASSLTPKPPRFCVTRCAQTLTQKHSGFGAAEAGVSSQSSMNIEIENYWELLALHKSLMAVKFDQNSCLREAQGSPYTGSLAFKVFDQLVAASNEKQAADWIKWQKADDSRIETQLLHKHIKESEWWADSDQSQKEKYVRDFMAPLILKERVFNEITKNC